MENTYVIAWKSKDEPRFGQGKKLLTREEAEQLADELNQDYPAFIHEAFNLAAPAEAPLAPDNIITPEFRLAEVSPTPAAEEPAREAAAI
jgi:hypothetical protein